MNHRRDFLKQTAFLGLTGLSSLVFQDAAAQSVSAPTFSTPSGFELVETGIENGSPLWYEAGEDGVIHLHLLYDHERSSPNRAAGHFHFVIHARPGVELRFEFRNLDNVWNGRPGSVARELKRAMISADGREWQPVALESLPENRVQLAVRMPGPRLYVARVEPYRISDLETLLARLSRSSRVKVYGIGRTVGGRELEVVRIGDSRAPHRVFVRARAHPWEAGSSWVAEGLAMRLISGDRDSSAFLKDYCVYLLPMANKDGVAEGRTRFNLLGKDLNRNWDKPVDAALAPENHALERWLESMIEKRQAPHLALELHNDGGGRLHLSRPPVPQLERYLARMAVFERLLREKTWFREGSTGGSFRNSGTLGDGWLERYGIDAVVHELNCNWIEGLQDYPCAKHWKAYGATLAQVFYEYFRSI